METDVLRRCGLVALAGRPNSGKSTLLNALLGQKISIVSSKPQTTRNRIVGVHNLPQAQLVLIDTPGLTQDRKELSRRMLRAAKAAAADADVVVYVADGARAHKGTDEVGKRLLSSIDGPVVVAVNKVDLITPKHVLLPVIQSWSEMARVQAVVPISALRQDGLDSLIEAVWPLLPEGEALFPEDMVTDRPERFIAGELIRERILKLTHEEVPHGVAVTVTEWKESPKGCHIAGIVHVERAAHKAILIGSKGAMIREIGTQARREIGRILDCEVHLNLKVEILDEWRRSPAALKRLGYDE